MAIIAQKRKPMAESLELKKEYAGDLWEGLYGKHGYQTGQAYVKVEPSGDMEQDFIHFVHGQGGGKSNDPNDPAAKNMPPKPDKDGVYYHTVNDITWPFFKANAQRAGIVPTSEAFYGMTKEQHAQMVDMFIGDMRKVFKVNSDAVAMVFVYAEWGSGRGNGIYGDKRYDAGALDLLDYYYQSFGMTVNQSIDEVGEYMTFYLALTKRREQMMRDTSNWVKYYKNWQSGLAHFHRVFKVYCKN